MEDVRQQPSRDGSGRPNRRQVVVDAKWQSAVATRIVATGMTVVGMVQLGVIALLSWGDLLESLTGSQLVMVACSVSCVQTGLLCLILWKTIIRITHTVAGPAMVLERAIDNLCRGKFDSRLTLRNGDYLKSLAAAVARLTAHLQEQEQKHQSAAQPQELAESVPPAIDRAPELVGREHEP